MSAPVIAFGKHRGASLDEMDPSYLEWMVRTADADESQSGPLCTFVADYRQEILAAISDARAAALATVDLDYILSPSQQAASEFLQEWLNGSEPAAKLEGGAGYGKSFCVLDVVRYALEQGHKVAAAATSYVATQVLVKQLDPLGVDVRTIARHLQLTVVYDGPKQNYVFSEESPERLRELLSPGHLLIVDEYSMVGDDIGKALHHAAELYGGRLLAVGDLSQLPPVGQDSDSVLASIPTSVGLTDPMRYSRDSDLYKVEQMARSYPYNLLNSAEQWDDSKQVQVVDTANDLIEQYEEDFVAENHRADKGDARMLFFRRADVVEANHNIRLRLYGSEALRQPVVEDEKLMVAATSDVYVNRGFETRRFYSGTGYRVVSYHTSEVGEIPCYIVKLDDYNNETRVRIMFMVTEAKADEDTLGGAEYNQELRFLAQVAQDAVEAGELSSLAWKPYREFKRQFLPVMYGYAMTVHRCQGQTVDRAYIEPRKLINAGGRRVGEKLLYVAATRAKQKLVMVL